MDNAQNGYSSVDNTGKIKKILISKFNINYTNLKKLIKNNFQVHF